MLCPVALRWSAMAEVLSFLARALEPHEQPLFGCFEPVDTELMSYVIGENMLV